MGKTLCGNRLTQGLCVVLLISASACTGTKWSEVEKESVRIVTQKGGATLGYSTTSGVSLLTADGYAFKDLDKDGELDPYEDWRLPAKERAMDLASKLSVEEIAGLMLYSAHQAVPGPSTGFVAATYGGKTFEESGADPSDLSDAQIKFLTEDNVRHVLVTSVQSPEVAARWNNNVQALVEGIGHGIPANNSSDPRHGTAADSEFNYGSGGQISLWPGTVGLAATFRPEVMKRFGEIASIEYRALGIATALSPQIDMATEPRWFRLSGTFGEDVDLATDMARAYVDGFQTSTGDKEITGGWGYESVNAMVKHWPGGGSGEGGRDAHYAFGKYAVYPGNNIEMQMKPFTEGAFKLEGGTGMASAVMPYYTISVGQNPEGADMGNSYNHYIISDQLRERFGYEGVVCTDWSVTADEINFSSAFSGKPWGAETLSVAERHYRILMAGVDQFGGNNDKGPVLEAYEMGVKEHGEAAMRARFEASAVRLLMNIFRTGLFENPYLDPAESQKVVGNPEFMQEAYDAQLASIVMLKNKNNVLPMDKGKKVYIPKRYYPSVLGFFGRTEAHTEDAANMEMVSKFYTVVDTPEEADFAIVFMSSPNSGLGYDTADLEKGGNGYMPISLQYKDYVATTARGTSLAGGDPLENTTNRSYRGKTVKTANIKDMLTVLETKAKMKDKPVIVSLEMSNPTIMSEFEASADAILVNFGVQNQAIFDIISGTAEPSALLPLQMPADMLTVEEQFEDVPRDMRCYTDSEGHTYDFAFGMNWKGVIDDDRVSKYK